MSDSNETTAQEASTEEAGRLNPFVMFDLQDQNKKLILHSAYFAVKQDEWKHQVFMAKMDKELKMDLVGKIPCGDPLNNLLNLAARLLPNFDGNAPINGEIEKIKAFVYGT